MQITLNIDSEQIISAISQLPIDAKLKIYNKVKSELRKYQLSSVLEEFKTDDISDEEINEIVEHVRTENYKNRP